MASTKMEHIQVGGQDGTFLSDPVVFIDGKSVFESGNQKRDSKDI